MQTILNLLSSETGLSIAAFILTTLWSLLKGSQLYQHWRTKTTEKAEKIIEAGAEEAYRELVADLKQTNPKLTPEQQKQAQDLAIEHAKAIGTKTGVDVAKTIGPELLRVAVVQAVKRLKAPSQLPANVKSLFLFILITFTICATGCQTTPANWTTASPDKIQQIAATLITQYQQSPDIQALAKIAKETYQQLANSNLDKNERLLLTANTLKTIIQKAWPQLPTDTEHLLALLKTGLQQ